MSIFLFLGGEPQMVDMWEQANHLDFKFVLLH